ncbi:hypothetical protein O3G_MSEX003502 [Manduca sexta]|uniref:Anamorsin N-terminal domain-containing protein n=1 Tax=Manduca sexta TaxID=7130 RepID=A0A921YSK8_MANSE|nr:hypothetical protein O3G_MSEX003502 [Manduca sexta]
MEVVKAGDNVLIIWNKDVVDEITNLVNEIKTAVQGGTVVLENSEVISEGARQHSSFDIVLSNWLAPHTVQHTDELLAIIVKLLKPSGKLLLKDTTDLTTTLKLNGFINITKNADNIYLAEKPKFEVGSKASLKLNGKIAATVWKLDSTVEEAWKGANDDDIIDENQLLEEEDLQRPDQESLRGNFKIYSMLYYTTIKSKMS